MAPGRAEQDLRLALGLAASTCRAPMAVLSRSRGDAWTELRHGTSLETTAAEIPFTRVTMTGRDRLVIEDATRDARFAQDPLVVDPPGVRAYLGVPLHDPMTRHVVGTLAILDAVPRVWEPKEIDSLETVARLVVDLIARRGSDDSDEEKDTRDPTAGIDAQDALGQGDASQDERDWAGLRDRLSDVLARIERLQRRNDMPPT